MFKLILPILILLSACNSENTVPEIQDAIIEKNDPHATHVDPVKFIVASSGSLSEAPLIKVLSTKNFSEEEKTRLFTRVLPFMETTMRSACFKESFLSKEMIQTNGKTPLEVYTDLTSNTVGINLTMYYKNNGVLGYTTKSADRVWMNKKFHSRFTTCESVSNLVHEVLGHKKSYVHDSKRTKRRHMSVPYRAGEAVLECCVDNEIKKKCYRSWRTGWKQVCK